MAEDEPLTPRRVFLALGAVFIFCYGAYKIIESFFVWAL